MSASRVGGREDGWNDSSDWIFTHEPVKALMAPIQCFAGDEYFAHESHSWYVVTNETVRSAGATVLRSSTIEWRWCDGKVPEATL